MKNPEEELLCWNNGREGKGIKLEYEEDRLHKSIWFYRGQFSNGEMHGRGKVWWQA
jgi:hypothetical protein